MYHYILPVSVRMEQNVTEAREINANGSSSVAYIVDIVLFFISWVGLVGNSVAMFILTSSVKIRKSKSYVLLMNQCLLDFTTTLFMITYLPLKYLGNWSNMSGSWDLIICHVIYNHLYVSIPRLSSSYNLVALSLGRMISVVWPIFHKIRCTRRMTLIVAVITWVLGFGIETAFAIPVNGINPVKRKCYYWNNLPSRFQFHIYSVLYNTFFVILPLTAMLTSYAVMYARISSRSMGPGIKLNVAGMLATCVLLFVCCHVLKFMLIMISNFSTTRIDPMRSLFLTSIIMVQINSIVNPLIYSLQYMDYKKELMRQFRKIFGRMSGKVSGSQSVETVTISYKL